METQLTKLRTIFLNSLYKERYHILINGEFVTLKLSKNQVEVITAFDGHIFNVKDINFVTFDSEIFFAVFSANGIKYGLDIMYRPEHGEIMRALWDPAYGITIS